MICTTYDIMQTSRLILPARKMLISELSRVIAVSSDTSIPDLHVWSIQESDKKLNFSVVWIQGTIVVSTGKFLQHLDKVKV